MIYIRLIETSAVMKPTLFLFLVLTCTFHSFAQSPSELYEKRDFSALAKLENNAGELNGKELYMVGYAFFRLANDDKAIGFYNKAIAKGLDDAGVHFYKGLSLRYQKKYSEALPEIELAISKDSGNQEYMNEKGLVYYYQEKLEQALLVFEEAKKLAPTFPDVYYSIARTYHAQGDFSKALAAYYEAVSKIPKGREYYEKSFEAIGQLEYTFAKNYPKSALAYTEAITLQPENYELQYKLIKSYNAGKEYHKADSLFKLVKKAFELGKLPKEDMEIKTIAIGQFPWNDQIAVIRRSLVDPKNTLDITYKVFLLNKTGDKVERRFVVEKTMQLEKDGANYLLCEEVKKTGGHITYPYGWVEDVIPLDDLQKAVTRILDGKLKMGASSNFSK